MNLRWILVIAVACPTCMYGRSAPKIRREKAIEQATACVRRKQVSSDQCIRLSGFYGEALLSDPESFLRAMAQLPKEQQQEVAIGVAGGMYTPLPSRDQFDALRTTLAAGVHSPERDVAQKCLDALNRNNAIFLVNYFPPNTLTSRAADFKLYLYSREMYSLHEKPLWPPSPEAAVAYRFTLLGAPSGPMSVTLDEKARIEAKTFNSHEGTLHSREWSLTENATAQFLSKLESAHFWEMPTEMPPKPNYVNLDGADWLLEGVRHGKYHVVVRWCPDTHPSSPQDSAFADAAKLLFHFAGPKYTRAIEGQ